MAEAAAPAPAPAPGGIFSKITGAVASAEANLQQGHETGAGLLSGNLDKLKELGSGKLGQVKGLFGSATEAAAPAPAGGRGRRNRSRRGKRSKRRSTKSKKRRGTKRVRFSRRIKSRRY